MVRKVGQTVTYDVFCASWPLGLAVFSWELLKVLVVGSKVKASGDLMSWQEIGDTVDGREY